MRPRMARRLGVIVAALWLFVCLMALGARSALEAMPGVYERPSTQSTPVVHRARPVRPLARMWLAPARGDVALGRAAPPGPFAFQSMKSADGTVIVHYYGAPATLAQEVIALAQDDLKHPVQDTLGFSLKQPVNIFMYQTRDDFLNGAPVTNPAETAALADPASNSVYIVIPDAASPGALDDLPHELTHIVFHQNEDVGQFEDEFFDFFPRWFDEGLAAYDEPAPYSADYTDALSTAVTNNQLKDFLQNFNNNYPSDPDTDFLAYAEARSFIGYLVDTYGLAELHQFLAGARDGDLDLDAEQVFGASLRILQGRWEVSLGVQPTVGNIGYVPAVSSPQPFTLGKLPPVASRTHPFALSGVDVISPSWFWALVEWMLAGLVGTFLWFVTYRWPRWRRQRAAASWARYGLQRQAPSGVPYLPPAPTSAPLVPAASSEPLVRVVPVLRAAPTAASVASVEGALSASAEGGEDTASVAAAIAAPDSVPSVPSVTASRTPSALAVAGPANWMPVERASKMRTPESAWPTLALLLLPVPFALGVGALAIRLDPLGEWRTGYLAAAIVGMPWALAAAYLMWRARRSTALLAFRGFLLLVIVVLVVAAWTQASPAGRAQAAAYEQQTAYALALRLYADSGESHADGVADQVRVHGQWGREAMAVNDYATAIVQLRTAIALDPHSSEADTDRAALTLAALAWGEALTAARAYPQALQVYAAQATWFGCDTGCATEMANASALTYLDWANVLLAGGDIAGALGDFQLITQRYAITPSARIARQALGEVSAQQALAAALAAGARGDIAAMNAQLHEMVAQYPTSAAATEASGVAESVSGAIRDASGASTAGDRVYFLAFASAQRAQRFNYDFSADDSVFKVATVAGPGGAFQVRLEPGYWYAAIWEDPSQAAYGGLNLPIAGGNDAFTPRPFTPSSVGIILGY